MKGNRHRSWDGAGVERSCGDPRRDRGDPDAPPGAASILPSLPPGLTQTHLRDPRPGRSSLTAPPAAPAPARLRLNSLTPKGIQVLWEFCSCSKHRGLFPSLLSPHTKCAQGASQLPPLPHQAECGAATRSLLSPCQEGSQSHGCSKPGEKEGRGVPRGRARIREGQNPPLWIPGTTTWGRKMQEGEVQVGTLQVRAARR